MIECVIMRIKLAAALIVLGVIGYLAGKIIARILFDGKGGKRG